MQKISVTEFPVAFMWEDTLVCLFLIFKMRLFIVSMENKSYFFHLQTDMRQKKKAWIRSRDDIVVMH